MCGGVLYIGKLELMLFCRLVEDSTLSGMQLPLSLRVFLRGQQVDNVTWLRLNGVLGVKVSE